MNYSIEILSLSQLFSLLEFDTAAIRLQSGLFHDGIILLAETFKQLGLERIQPGEIGCENGTMWENGLSISNFMRTVSEAQAVFLFIDECIISISTDNCRWFDWNGEIRYRRPSYWISGANPDVDIAWFGADWHMESKRWHSNGQIAASNAKRHRQRPVLQSNVHRAHDYCKQTY